MKTDKESNEVLNTVDLFLFADHLMNSLLIHNANILSFHEGFKQKGFDCMFVEGNTIKAIGRYDDLKSLIHPHTIIINAAGKTLMPGFNDSHIHIWKVGSLKTYVLDVRNALSLDEMLQMIKDYAAQYPDAAWVMARGFNEAAWIDGRLPNKDDLDKVVNNRPVHLLRTCAHIAVCNTNAIQTCGITATTIVPNGGYVYLGDDGKPNGIFAETALGLITKHIPAYSKAQLKTMVQAAKEEMFRYGITAATDPACDPFLLQAYHEMNQADELGFRLSAMPIVLPDGGTDAYPIPDYFSSPFMQINTVKFFSDGGLSGKTAAIKRHYKNTNEQGLLRLDKEKYAALSMLAMQKNLSVATHAIGDAAIEFVIDVYKDLHNKFPYISNRIEHLGLPEEKHLQHMAEYDIAASMQTIFIYELGKNFRKYIDDDYLNRCYPVRSVLNHGVTMALSSDAPVVKNFNPLQGIATAINRKDNDGNVIAPGEGITITEALKAYTATAATLTKTNLFGSIKEGMLADFILLDKNPVTSADLSAIKVLQTYVDGKLVWNG
ncbi:amidohydrolase [soil metagenome]